MAIDFEEVVKSIKAFNRYASDVDSNFLAPRNNLYDNEFNEVQPLLQKFHHQKQAYFRLVLQENGLLAKAIGVYSEGFFIDQGYEEELKMAKDAEPDNMHHNIVRSTIRQFWRDWSSEGSTERNSCIRPIVDDIIYRCHDRSRYNFRILIPGAGLCRLAYDLAAMGFTVSATDVSYIQLLATNFILSRTKGPLGRCLQKGFLGDYSKEGAISRFTLYPWALQFSNHKLIDDQFENVEVPDARPATQLGVPTLDTQASVLRFNANRLSLCAMDFTRDYNRQGYSDTFNVVATMFFIDTARNFLDYAKTVYKVLKKGGIWVNIGPLLWNCYENGPGGRREGDIDADEDTRLRFENAGSRAAGLGSDVGRAWQPKIELSNEEVLDLLKQMGFHVSFSEILPHKAGYIQDPKSMLQSKYKLAHWVAEKS